MKSAILLLAFNRPEKARLVFKAVRKVRPPRLYVAVDGPRSTHEGESLIVNEVQQALMCTDWPCQLQTLFRPSNLGCREAVSSAIDWFFSHESEGIILEDDCLPHPDFFPFCEELLELYRDEKSVWMISGNNFQNGKKHGACPYYFSKYPHIWGWATWQRCWRYYDVGISFWPEWEKSKDFKKLLTNKLEREHWKQVFNQSYSGLKNTWDYQWVASMWKGGGLAVTPQENLVTNIGAGEAATHTIEASSLLFIPAKTLKINGKHPSKIEVRRDADEYVFKSVFGGGKRLKNGFSKKTSWFLGIGFSSGSANFLQRSLFILAKMLFETPLRLLALGLLGQLKKQRAPIETIDYLRAKIYIKMGRDIDAIEVLKEEVRLFPCNYNAVALLQELENIHTVDPASSICNI